MTSMRYETAWNVKKEMPSGNARARMGDSAHHRLTDGKYFSNARGDKAKMSDNAKNAREDVHRFEFIIRAIVYDATATPAIHTTCQPAPHM